MEAINLLGGAMGLSFVSGINLYATILAVGVGMNSGLIKLAPGMESLEVLGHPLILIIAGAMYTAEFFADKVPWVDSAWDTVHTFIRPIGGALIASSAVGQLDPAAELAVMLAGGSIALSTHATKASARLVINQSPEPFTNTAASVVEDVVAFGGAWLSLRHPAVMLVLVVISLIIIGILGPKVLRLLRVELNVLATLIGNLARDTSVGWERLDDKYRAAVPEGFSPRDTDFCLRAVGGKGTGLRRNLMGALCMQDDRLVFLSRSYFRPKCCDLDLTKAEEAWLETKLLLHRLCIQMPQGLVQFHAFRDRTGRAGRAMDLIKARVEAKGKAPAAAAGAGPTPDLDDSGAPA